MSNVLLIKDGERIYLADTNFGGIAKDSTLQETNNILNSILNQVAKDETIKDIINFLKKPYNSVFKRYDITQDFNDTIVDNANSLVYVKLISTLSNGNLIIKIANTEVINIDLSDVTNLELSKINFVASGSISISVSNVSNEGKIYLWLSYI